MCRLLGPVLIINRLLFFLSLWPFTELLKQTRQALSSLYYLDVYGATTLSKTAHCHYADCHILYVMLNVVMLMVVMLSVMVPLCRYA
jgi:hypothetical protein